MTVASPMCVVLLVRHGRTAFNADGRSRGHLDPPLDEIGEAEVAALARLLADVPVVRIVTSPLRRAVQTAHTIAGRCGVAVSIDGRLIDRDYARWAGHRVEQVTAEWGSLDAAPGVEDIGTVVIRARAALDEQARVLDAGSVVLVSHDAVNRSLLSSLDDTIGPVDELPQRTACFNILSRVHDQWRVDRIDEKAAGREDPAQASPDARSARRHPSATADAASGNSAATGSARAVRIVHRQPMCGAASAPST